MPSPPPPTHPPEGGMSSPEQTLCEHNSRRVYGAWPWTDRSICRCPSVCACRGSGLGADIVIPITAMLPARATLSTPVNGISRIAARSGTLASTATTAVDPRGYGVHTQSLAAPPYSPLGPHGVLEDPSRDPDTWSLATPTPVAGSRAPSIHENNVSNGTLATPPPSPQCAKFANRGKEVTRSVFAYFTTYILPVLLILPTVAVFYFWAWQVGIYPIPGSDFYRKYAWFHTYPAPRLTPGGAWSIAAVLYSIIGGALHHVLFGVWLQRMRRGKEGAERRARLCPCNCTNVLFIMMVVLYILMVPLLGSAGFLSVYALLTTPARGES